MTPHAPPTTANIGRVTVFAALGVALCLGAVAGGQDVSPSSQPSHAPTTPPPASQPAITAEALQIENEMINTVIRQTFGPYTVEDLALPPDFLQRVSDRAFRAAYERQYRIIVADRPGSSATALPATQPASGTGGTIAPAAFVVAAIVIVAVLYAFLRSMKKESAS